MNLGDTIQLTTGVRRYCSLGNKLSFCNVSEILLIKHSIHVMMSQIPMPAIGSTVTSAWVISNVWGKQVSEIYDWSRGIGGSSLGKIHQGLTESLKVRGFSPSKSIPRGSQTILQWKGFSFQSPYFL